MECFWIVWIVCLEWKGVELIEISEGMILL